ncbi:hypothetical protein Taro_023316, partial [Colocasia esculenta]|nr:hypothetical protein [Colocasia esculenta]
MPLSILLWYLTLSPPPQFAVEKALPQVVPSITLGKARNLFHESRQNGVTVVIVTVKEHAEFYAQMMVRGGLRSAIEPDSSTYLGSHDCVTHIVYYEQPHK